MKKNTGFFYFIFSYFYIFTLTKYLNFYLKLKTSINFSHFLISLESNIVEEKCDYPATYLSEYPRVFLTHRVRVTAELVAGTEPPLWARPLAHLWI